MPYPSKFPSDMLTSARERFRRLRVDVAQTGFFEGREFRSYKELSIGAGAKYVIRFTAATEFILFDQKLVVDAGSIRLRVFTGGTPGGTFSEVLPVIGKNRMLSRPSPFYVAQNMIHAGGTITGGTEVELVRVIAATATAQQQSVGGAVADERGLPVGTYYLEFENISTGTATGTYSLWFEERL